MKIGTTTPEYLIFMAVMSVLVLSVVLPNVIMLNVVASFKQLTVNTLDLKGYLH
jgi:hypothetical protein